VYFRIRRKWRRGEPTIEPALIYDGINLRILIIKQREERMRLCMW
jgi:hypothetical protein